VRLIQLWRGVQIICDWPLRKCGKPKRAGAAVRRHHRDVSAFGPERFLAVFLSSLRGAWTGTAACV